MPLDLCYASQTMSRSYRKTPIMGMAGGETKSYKRRRVKQERARVREALAHGDHENLDKEQAPWNEWASGRDGLQYLPPDLRGYKYMGK